MYLTPEEQKMLDGGLGPAKQKAMEILVALGDIYSAERMVPVSSVQVSGISYKTIGDAGIDFLEEFVSLGARTSVLTTLNPAGTDLSNWKALGFPEDFAKKQQRIIDAFTAMGAVPCCTCTPYFIGNVPRVGEHISWSESSAVCFSNSVLGAMTNREGGPSALCASITGCTPLYGYHLKENRKGTMLVKVQAELKSEADFGKLGYHIGALVKDGIPVFDGLENPTTENLKALSAALAASGGVAMFHAVGITPEARTIGEAFQGDAPRESVVVGEAELRAAGEKLSSGKVPDLVCFGCPHCSIEEIRKISDGLKGKKTKIPVWVCASQPMVALAKRCGYVDIIEAAGGKMLNDTCLVVSPVKEMGFKCIATNSAKGAHYTRNLSKLDSFFGSMEMLLKIAVGE